MKISYQWLQTYFDDPLPPASELEELVSLRAFEIESIEEQGGDRLIDVDVLPNRSSDCLCHRGIAREVAALLDKSLKDDPLRRQLPVFPASGLLNIEIQEPELCPRYLGAVVRGVTVGPSPAWLRQALEHIGQKSINNVVDITNYVMCNLGQPLHAFDMGKLESEGGYGITVRLAKEGERMTDLSGTPHTLSGKDLVIADTKSGTVLGLAGIKGSKAAEVDAGTRDIIIEAANFNYVSVRKSSYAHKLITDASVRFQNEPSPALPPYALRDCVELILAVAGGVLEGVAEQGSAVYERAPIIVALEDINALLGSELSSEEVAGIFRRLDFDMVENEGRFAVLAPFERTDISIAEDLIEEVGRVYGYEHITARLPEQSSTKPSLNKRFYWSERIRAFFVEQGYSEVYTYTLRERGEVALENPLAADKAFMRSELHRGLAEVLERNMHHAPLLGIETVALFELGTIFPRSGERLSLCLGARAVRGKQTQAAARVSEALAALGGLLGHTLIGEVKDGVCEIDLETIMEALPEPQAYESPKKHPPALFKPFSPYPFVLRDIALWTPEDTRAEEAEEVIRTQAGTLLVRLDLFDTFAKDGRLSLAFHLVFQSEERTLTDAEVGDVMQQVEAACREKGWEVR